jgi:AraC-like DNA-binding protein
MLLNISSEEKQLYLVKLENILASKKLFLKHDFCMPKLAQEAGIPLYIISYVINSEVNVNFTDYINLMRIKYFTEKINDPVWKDLKLKEMSKASGFKCRTSCYRAFVKHFGMSPSQYLESYSK